MQPLPRHVAVILTCGLIALIGSVEVYFDAILKQAEIGETNPAHARLFAWAIWLPLSPAILWIGERFPLPRLWHAHLAAALAVAAIHGSALHWLAGIPARLVPAAAPWAIAVYADIQLLYYAVAALRGRHESEIHAERLQRQLAAAELRALRMQLDPHFLFNAFNSIASLLQTQPREASRVLSHLASFLRLTLDSKGQDRVRLAEELEFVRSYLEVERARFRDRLVADLAPGGAPMDALVPNLILQPLVENAVRHGGGTVHVAVESGEDRLSITVSDNGPGFPDNAADGVGLSNTRARLRELYGPRHRLECRNRPEGGAEVRLELPLERAASEGTE